MKRLLILLLAASPLALGAQTRLTLDECLAEARANNRSLAAAGLRAEAGRFEARSMRANLFPSLSATGMALFSTSEGELPIKGGKLPVFGPDNLPTCSWALFPGMNIDYKVDWVYGGGLTLKQPIFMGGKVRTGYRMARIGASLFDEQRRLTESEVVLLTSRAYADVVRARELLEVARRYDTLLAELLRTVESARRHGLKPQNDVLKVRVRCDESALQLRRAEHAVRLATMNLCHRIGRSLDEAIEPSDSLPTLPVAPASDPERRPEWRLLDHSTDLAREQVRLARSERLPQIGLVGNYGYMHGVRVAGQPLFDGMTFSAGVQVSIPIFGFGSRTNKVRAAQARFEAAEAERDETHELLLLELRQAADRLDEARLEIRLTESARLSADENLRASTAQYRVGTESLSDHLEAQTLWQQAHGAEIEARIDGYLRYLEYCRAAGCLD